MRTLLQRLTGLAAAALLAFPPSLAAQPAATEQEVKAAFLYKFPAFVEWPERPHEAFVIAVAGADEIAGELARLGEGREILGRRIVVKPLREGESAAGAQMLFVGRDSPRLAQLARSVAGQPVLVVSESPGALEQGSLVNFVLVEGRVRFEVALDAAERHGLRISPRLLALASRVRTARP
jgi:hypothetical protein